ncbi:MAG: protein kinase domain-containing protein, partial [Bacteroidota bacterium]
MSSSAPTEIAAAIEVDRAEPDGECDRPSRKTTSPPELLVEGGRIDRFEVHTRLGSGSFGVVWKCYDTKLERFVAIKVSKSQAGTAPLSGNLLDEAKRVAKLAHDGIVRVFDVLQIGAEFGIVSELIVGQTLKERLESSSMPQRELLAVIQQVAAGLQHAHQA